MSESTAGALRQLAVVFDIAVDSAKLEKFDKSLDATIGKLKSVGEAIGTAFAFNRIRGFFEGQINAAAHIQDLADRLGTSATAIKEFGFVAQSSGIGIDEAAHALGHLQRAIGEASKGGKEQAAAFAALGLSARDAAKMPLPDVVEKLADGFKNKLTTQSDRSRYAIQLFSRAGLQLVPIFAQGGDAIHKLTLEAAKLSSGLGDDYYKQAKAAREESLKLAFVWQSVKDRLVSAAIPAITWLLEKMQALAGVVLDLEKQTGVATTALEFFAVVAGVQATRAVVGLLSKFGLLKPTILETIGALLEFAAPILIVGALYLAFDDLWTLMKGGKSVIGEALNELTGDTNASTDAAIYLNAAWQDVLATIKDVGKIVGGVWHAVSGTLDALDKLDVQSETAGVGPDAVSKMWGALLDSGRSILGANQQGGSEISAGLSGLFGVDGSNIANMHALLASGMSPRDVLAYQNGRLRAPGTSVAGAAAGVVQHNAIQVDVHTASDQPNAVGRATGGAIATPLQRAAQNALTAVKRR